MEAEKFQTRMKVLSSTSYNMDKSVIYTVNQKFWTPVIINITYKTLNIYYSYIPNNL